MRPRSILAPALATLALLTGAAPALGATAGQTFLLGGLDLPAGAIGGAGGSGYSADEPDAVSVSADGRYVAFPSVADGLDPAADRDVSGIFRKDLDTGAVVLVSRANGANGAAAGANSFGAAISDDGRRVAFITSAALDPADVDAEADVYVRDLDAGTTTLASVGNAGRQTTSAVGASDLSGNGRYVAFTTDASLDAVNDPGVASDVYVRDLLAATTALASSPDGSAAAGNAASYTPSISDDGRWVAFVSDATNLVGGYATGGSGRQLFARDRTAGRTHLVSADQGSATRGGNGQAAEPDIAGAPTGTLSTVTIAYASGATNVASGGVDGSTETSVYLRTLSSTPSVLVSRADGGDGANADSRAHTPSISDDANLVVFDSDATNLGPGNNYYGTYLRNVSAARTVLASTDNRYAVQGAIADDGSLVAWVNGAGVTADSDPDLNGVFARAYAAPATMGAARFVSRPAGAAPFLAQSFDVGEPVPGSRAVSADGRYVVFLGYASRLPGANPPYAQAYRRDTLTGALELVSRANGASGGAASGYVAEPTISADGSRVAFASAATNLEAGTGRVSRVYVRDVAAGTTTLVARADGAGGAVADSTATHPRISADGRHVAFVSNARNLGDDPSGGWHVYLRDLATADTLLVDRATGAGGALADSDPVDVQLSGDGRSVLVRSTATNLDPADGDADADLFVRDTVASTTTLVSRRGGLAGAKAVGGVQGGTISTDGSTVAFATGDETLAPEAGPWGGYRQIVARTLATGANVLVSRAPGGAPADGNSYDASVSGDGSVVAFDSSATNLLPGVGGITRSGVFARTMSTGALSGPPAFGIVEGRPQSFAVAPALSDDGQCMAFIARGHNAATGAAGDFATVYMYVVSGTCPKAPVPVARGGTPKPGLSKVSLSHKRFRVGRKPTATKADADAAAHASAKRKRARRAPVGTAFRFTLTTRANVAIAIERPAPGRLAGRLCKRPTRRLRTHLRCVRFVRVGRISRGGLRAGRGSIAFSGRIGRRALKPGAYRARLRASNSAGVSRWVRVTFSVVR